MTTALAMQKHNLFAKATVDFGMSGGRPDT
jgi:hypothetical protein